MEDVTRWLSGMPVWLLILWVAWAVLLIAVFVATANTRTRGLVHGLTDFVTHANTQSREEMGQLRGELGEFRERTHSLVRELTVMVANADTRSREELRHLRRELSELHEQLKSEPDATESEKR